MTDWKGDACFFFIACGCSTIWSRNLVMNLWLHSWEEMISTFISECFYFSSTIAVN